VRAAANRVVLFILLLVVDLKKFAKNIRGISEMTGALLLVAGVVIIGGALWVVLGGLTPSKPTPVITVNIMDHPDPVNAAGANFTIIRFISGDKVRYDDLEVIIRDDSGKEVGLVDNLGSYAQDVKNNNYFEGGDQIIIPAGNNYNTPGTYTIELLYKPKDAILVSKTISVS